MSETQSTRREFVQIGAKIAAVATAALALGYLMPVNKKSQAAVLAPKPARQPEPQQPQEESAPKTGKPKHRILCLNGAATLAYFEVSSLIDLYGEKTRGRDVLKNFNEVYAVSSGGLLLSGLIANYELGEIRDMIADPNFLKLVYPRKPDDPNDSCVSPCYSAEKKTENFRRAIGGIVSADDPSVKKVPALAKGQARDLPDLPFHEIPAAIGLDSIKITYLCQNADDKKLALVRSRKCKETETKIFDGTTVHQISGDSPFAAVVSATANPNGGILFDKPVTLNGMPCNDGGAAGFNDPTSIAVWEALQSGVPADEIAVLSLGIGPRPVNPWSPVTLAQKTWTIGQNHLQKKIPSWGYALARFYYEKKMSHWQHESFEQAFSMLYKAGVSHPHLYRLAPSLEGVCGHDDFRYLPSDAQTEEETNIMKEAFLDYKKGSIPNQRYTDFVDQNGFPRVVGHKVYARAVAEVRDMFAPGTQQEPRYWQETQNDGKEQIPRREFVLGFPRLFASPSAFIP